MGVSAANVCKNLPFACTTSLIMQLHVECVWGRARGESRYLFSIFFYWKKKNRAFALEELETAMWASLSPRRHHCGWMKQCGVVAISTALQLQLSGNPSSSFGTDLGKPCEAWAGLVALTSHIPSSCNGAPGNVFESFHQLILCLLDSMWF